MGAPPRACARARRVARGRSHPSPSVGQRARACASLAFPSREESAAPAREAEGHARAERVEGLGGRGEGSGTGQQRGAARNNSARPPPLAAGQVQWGGRLL
eukprot:2035606-Prymnesium_polylepis.1